LAKRFEAPIEAVRRANLRCADLNRIANATIDRMLNHILLQLFFPLKLEKPTKGDMDFAFLSQFQSSIWVEKLHDGLKFQIHKVDDRVELFDTEGKHITHRFPEIAESALLIAQDYIADGKLVA
tara:strand:- start:79960 stop:80331 length:372 start_codon:yes stop_codon:yes gene_type:complete